MHLHQTKCKLQDVALEGEIEEPIPEALHFIFASAEEGFILAVASRGRHFEIGRISRLIWLVG